MRRLFSQAAASVFGLGSERLVATNFRSLLSLKYIILPEYAINTIMRVHKFLALSLSLCKQLLSLRADQIRLSSSIIDLDG